MSLFSPKKCAISSSMREAKLQSNMSQSMFRSWKLRSCWRNSDSWLFNEIMGSFFLVFHKIEMSMFMNFMNLFVMTQCFRWPIFSELMNTYWSSFVRHAIFIQRYWFLINRFQFSSLWGSKYGSCWNDLPLRSNISYFDSMLVLVWNPICDSLQVKFGIIKLFLVVCTDS